MEVNLLSAAGRLAIVAAALFMHHLVFMVTSSTIIDHHPTTMVSSSNNNNNSRSSSMTGFSLHLVTHDDATTNIHRGNDGFLHLLHQNYSSAASIHPQMHHPPRLPSVVLVHLGNVPHQYMLKLDTTSMLTWLQCHPCDPHAPQFSPIFDPTQSSTFRSVPGTSPICRPPYHAAEGGAMCSFHITGGPSRMSVRGFLAHEKLMVGNYVVDTDFLLGCAHSTRHFESRNRYAGVTNIGRTTAPTSLVTQAAARGLTRFSYCLFVDGSTTTTTGDGRRRGFLRFGSDVPRLDPDYRQTTRILPALHETDSQYYVSLVGISLGARRLDGIREEMFARRQAAGGCVVDLGASLTTMVHDAYSVVEDAIWSDLLKSRHDDESVVERVERRPGFNLCFRVKTDAMKQRRLLPSLSLHFAGGGGEKEEEEEATLVLSPKQLFVLMTDDGAHQGDEVACLAMVPGNRTVIGAFQQVDTRFVFDVKESTLSFASEPCVEDSTLV